MRDPFYHSKERIKGTFLLGLIIVAIALVGFGIVKLFQFLFH